MSASQQQEEQIQNLESELNRLKQQITMLKEDSSNDIVAFGETTIKAIEKNATQIAEITSHIGQLESAIEANTRHINSLGEDIQGLKADVQKISGFFDWRLILGFILTVFISVVLPIIIASISFNSKLSAHEVKLENLQSSIKRVESSLQSDIARIGSNLEKTNQRIDRIENRLNSVENRILSVENRLHTVENRLNSLEVTLAEVKGAIQLILLKLGISQQESP